MPGKIGIGIDIGTSAIKFAKVSVFKSEIKLLDIAYFPLPGVIEENFSKEQALRLKNFLKTRKIKLGSAIVGISGSHVNIQYLKVPYPTEERIRSVVEIGMKEMIEKTGIHMAYDFLPIVVPKDSQKPDRIVIKAIAHDSYLNQIICFLKNAGIKVKGFVPNSMALYNAFKKFAHIPDKETVYIADIGHSNTNLVITEEASLYFLRNVNMGSNVINQQIKKENVEATSKAESYKLKELDLSPNKMEHQETIKLNNKESFQNRMIFNAQAIPDVLEASLKFAKMQTGFMKLKIDKILLTGGASKQKGLKELLKSHLKCPVEDIILTNIDTSSLSLYGSDLIKEKRQTLLSAIGCAELAVNSFIPLKVMSIKQKLIENILGKQLFEYCGVIIAFIIALWVSFSSYSNKQYHSQLKEQLDSRYKKLMLKNNTLKNLKKENEILKKQLLYVYNKVEPGKQFLIFLTWLIKNIPKQMYIRKLHFYQQDGEKIVKISGIIEESTQDVYTVLKNFQKVIKKAPDLALKKQEDPKFDGDEGRLEFSLYIGL